MNGDATSHQLLSDFCAAMTEGKLREADASMAAWHLHGLLTPNCSGAASCTADVVTEDEIKTSAGGHRLRPLTAIHP